MKRGCTLDFVTFHSSPYTPPAALTKAAALAKILNRHQSPGRLVAVNLLPLQKAVRDRCTERFRTVLYRRSMFRIASAIAGVLGDRALATGENLGQVASQTLANLSVIGCATDMLVLRPVLTADKNDTVQLARRIGTFEVSSEPAPDSCTVFAPGNPATSAPLDIIRAQEHKLPLEALLEQCAALTVLIDPDTLHETPLDGLAGRFDGGAPASDAAGRQPEHTTDQRPEQQMQ